MNLNELILNISNGIIGDLIKHTHEQEQTNNMLAFSIVYTEPYFCDRFYCNFREPHRQLIEEAIDSIIAKNAKITYAFDYSSLPILKIDIKET